MTKYIKFLKSTFGNVPSEVVKVDHEDDKGNVYYTDGFDRYCYLNIKDDADTFKLLEKKARKPKVNQPETPGVAQGRDLFQTPRYAVELLVPYIPKRISFIWECAAGERKISRVLNSYGYSTLSSDIRSGVDILQLNFLTSALSLDEGTAIITNPPFSVKEKFFNKCLEYKVPFALLIPADYSLWTINAIRNYGCRKLVPSRRIDYITPTGKLGRESQGQFHSMWLCKDFDLPEQETFVELTNKMKKESI